MQTMRHQYIARDSGALCDEPLFADRLIGLMYNQVRDNAPGLFPNPARVTEGEVVASAVK